MDTYIVQLCLLLAFWIKKKKKKFWSQCVQAHYWQSQKISWPNSEKQKKRGIPTNVWVDINLGNMVKLKHLTTCYYANLALSFIIQNSSSMLS